ncbi:Aste57867_30 [Aphanomyces stellatus]|uniref:Aste57867_30 protein n=1 Tax=Aphanomyces stellatus TaxID=120398 RepID=A0A485K2S9_9STRA|nr:hypothetical protein As57867_000030 [Aphanomyces stellatus]VFT77256.1 Aste57867_30 [Aphanomyces stellatus]
MRPASVATVLHSSSLLSSICSFQDGVTFAIQEILKCHTVQGIHGRLLRQADNGSMEMACFPTYWVNGDHIHMDALPAFMEHRRQAMAVVLDNPRAAATLRAMLATHSLLRDVVAEYAAFYGDLELLQLICENAKERLPWLDVDMPTDSHFPAGRYRSRAVFLDQLAAFHGHVAILELLTRSQKQYGRRGAFTRYSDLEVAAERGHLACVRLAIEFAASDTSTYWGLRNPIPEYHNQRTANRGSHHLPLLDFVAGDGHLEIAHLLFDHGAPYSEAALDKAATNGHLAMAQYFHEKPNSKCTTQAMDGAAANGHLEVVQFLHDHRTEGCTTRALDEAAVLGHDAVVRFLLDTQSTGGSVKAMNAYVAKGDLDMVKLLAMGKCSSGSVNVAAAHGHLTIVKYLVGEKEVAFAAPAIEAAVKHGHANVVDYLHTQRPEICVAKFMQLAHGNAQPAIVDYFDSHRCECCKDITREDVLVAKSGKKRRRKN